jgi:hypothetical protein
MILDRHNASCRIARRPAGSLETAIPRSRKIAMPPYFQPWQSII